MPWMVESPMSLRREFVSLASKEDSNVSMLCRRFGISRKTGYKWLERAAGKETEPLADRSRRPHVSPSRTAGEMEQLVIALRKKRPAWGARKLKRRLEDQGHAQVPARSTINDILHRHQMIDPDESAKHVAVQRFERATPNELWQMDFKSPVVTVAGSYYPLTVLDDHSRYNILLKVCENQQKQTVQDALTGAMRVHGMPACILTDNGPPWGSFGDEGYFTALGAWLIRRGVSVIHGRPLHPQTQGKEERFHRTLQAEAIASRVFRDGEHCQQVFDDWRPIYNHERPHEALDMQTPAARYSVSQRQFPETAPPVEYGPDDQVRKVCSAGRISFHGRSYRIGHAFCGEQVGIRPTTKDGMLDVFYCHQRVAEIDLCDESGDR